MTVHVGASTTLVRGEPDRATDIPSPDRCRRPAGLRPTYTLIVKTGISTADQLPWGLA